MGKFDRMSYSVWRSFMVLVCVFLGYFPEKSAYWHCTPKKKKITHILVSVGTSLELAIFHVLNSEGSNYVQNSMVDCSKPKIAYSSLITKRWTLLNSFDVQKNNVRVISISDLVNLVKALLGLMFHVCSFKTKNRAFKFDHQPTHLYWFQGL